VLRRAGEALQRHTDELRDWLVRESGGIPGKAYLELGHAAQNCYEAAALPSRSKGELLPSSVPRLSMVRRVPAGVVGVIAPFNGPLALAMRSVAPALALGNAVCSSRIRAPQCVAGRGRRCRTGRGSARPGHLVHRLDHGRSGGRRAGRSPPQTGDLELGGNSALIVLDDADLEQAISAAAFGSFFHQGQICTTIGRHVVHESLYPEYVQRLAAKADGLPGDRAGRARPADRRSAA
jgi:benzaldehyde dehydrogenase (NAD)